VLKYTNTYLDQIAIKASDCGATGGPGPGGGGFTQGNDCGGGDGTASTYSKEEIAKVTDWANANFKNKEAAKKFVDWFTGSRVLDEDGNPIVVYHGTQRPDRLHNVFDPERATSGPMAFFTDDAEIAGKYATGKRDTSLERAGDYHGWFEAEVNGETVDLKEAWRKLPREKREEIASKLPHVTNIDKDGVATDTYRLGDKDEWGLSGEGHWDWTIKQEAKGNVLDAAKQIWLDGGGLYNSEKEFLEVLKLGGFDTDVKYKNPDAAFPAVYAVHLNIKNPLDTSKIPAKVIDAITEAAEYAPPALPDGYGADDWDKRTKDPTYWIERLNEGDKFVWSSIPDFVTETLKEEGYDGIFDTGGKMGGKPHTVYIPFESEQIKSSIANSTFDPNDPNINKAASNCGASGGASGGFKEGNTCASGDGTSSTGTIEVDKDKQKQQQDTPKFKNWFGNSVVANADGSPLIVYHGSPDVRDIMVEGFQMGYNRADNGWFFTNKESVANTYADEHRAWDFQKAEPHVIPVYLSIQNPDVIDAKGRKWRETEKHVARAKANGHDGIIIRNSRDEYNNVSTGGEMSDVYVVFDNKQIKSGMTGPLKSRVDGKEIGGGPNSGAFSTSDANILKSSDCGATGGPNNGFATGNDCAAGDGTSTTSGASKIQSKKDAVAKIREQPDNIMNGWFRNGDKNYKPRLAKLIQDDPELRESGNRIMYDNWKNTIAWKKPETENWSYEKFMDTPTVLYRAGSVRKNDSFLSFTQDIKMAERHRDSGIGGSGARGGEITKITLKPRQTWGSYTTTAELEILVPPSEIPETAFTKSASGCGATGGPGPGGGGFTSGNDCAGGSGGSASNNGATKQSIDEYKTSTQSKIDELKTKLDDAEKETMKERRAVDELRSKYGKDDPRYREALKTSNENIDATNAIAKEYYKRQRQLEIVKDGKKIEQAQNLEIAEGLDINPVVANALLENALYKPYMDHSKENADRYKYTLTEQGTFSSFNNSDTYDFVVEPIEEFDKQPLNTIEEIPDREGYVYRGMSNEEWQLTKERGYLQSAGTLNIGDGQDGLTFYGGSRTAELYANGFTHPEFKPTKGKPGVVVEIPRSLVMDHTDDENIPRSEFAHTGSVPIDKIESRFELHAVGSTKGKISLTHQNREKYNTSYNAPSVQHAIKQVGVKKKLPPGDNVAKQQAQIKTPSFKNWFKGSKVAKKDGSPLVVHHATDANFDEFKVPAYFTTNKRYANDMNRKRIVSTYLSIKNPADLRKLKISPSRSDFADVAKELKKQGYDGAQYRNEAYIAFDPKQIKSVTDNTGDFDANIPDMRKGFAKASDCGATGGPQGGFTVGNDCAAGDGSGGKIETSKQRSGPISRDEAKRAKELFDAEEQIKDEWDDEVQIDGETSDGNQYELWLESQENKWLDEDNDLLVTDNYQGDYWSEIPDDTEWELNNTTEKLAGDGSIPDGSELLDDVAKFYTKKGDGIVNSHLRNGSTRDAKKFAFKSTNLNETKLQDAAQSLNKDFTTENLDDLQKQSRLATNATRDIYSYYDEVKSSWLERGTQETKIELNDFGYAVEAAERTGLATGRSIQQYKDGKIDKATLLQRVNLASEFQTDLANKTNALVKRMDQDAVYRIKQLDKITNFEIRGGKPFTVYRGIGVDNAKDLRLFDSLLKAKVGAKYKMKAYGSSSLDRKQAMSFATEMSGKDSVSILLKVKTTKGAFIDKYSEYKGEKEVLLPRGSTYKVNSKKLVRRDKNGQLTLFVDVTRED